MKLVLVAALFIAPQTVLANDLSDALAYIGDASDESLVAGYEDLTEAHDDAALGMLISRNVTPGKELSEYDCSGSPIDQEQVLRTSGEERWAHRYCLRARFKKDSLPGYKTLGTVQLRERDVDDWVRVASRQTQVPAALIHFIILYSSGYRPGAISDRGHYGLMQLSPQNLRAEGISFGDLLDPRENILVGAKYIEKLIYRFNDMKLALAAYIKGSQYIEDAGRVVPQDRETVWFMREMLILYYVSIRKVPAQLGAENMAWIWNWMD